MGFLDRVKQVDESDCDDNLAWTHLSDLKYWDSEIPALYGVRGIPANVLLDPDGVIVAKNITGEDLHKN